MNEELYMKRAFELSLKSWGKVSPNPYVGAMLVKNGEVVAEGWHLQCGSPHAEIEALAKAGDQAKGSTIYVTLEPCCHHGKTGPCTEAIIKAGIKKVVYAIDDPNPLVAGKGKKKLEDAGIEVVSGVLSDEAEKINEIFFFNQRHKKTFVALKAAMSLDGKMATSNYKSQWITGAEARERTHELRAGYDAILVGAGTLCADNPQLTVRSEKFQGMNPTRLVLLGSQTEIDINSQIFDTQEAPTWLIYPEGRPIVQADLLKEKNVQLVPMKEKDGKIEISALLEFLYQEGIQSLFVEGGPAVHTSFLESGNVQRLYLFVAPKLIGGGHAPGIWNGDGISELQKAPELINMEIELFGKDILITGRLSEVK